MESKNIYEYIKTEEAAFKLPITVTEGYEWNLYDHVRKTVLYKNSTYLSGKDDNKPYKNIIRPILNLAYRAEGFDVKDIQLFVDDASEYYKSFLIKKFHEKWARENGIDTFIDDVVENYADFGGALIKNVNQKKPEVVPWQRVAFCDQTDILSGPLGEKHYYSPDQLKEMASRGWGDKKRGATGTIDEVIDLADKYKKNQANTGKQSKTPGKYIEVYEVHGMLPKSWLKNEEEYSEEDGKASNYVQQLQICTFYKDENGNKQGITLFKGPEKESIYKIILRDKIYGRGLGMGGAEELFEPQVWTNYSIIRIKEMLDAACKVIYKTTDPAFTNRNKTSNLENGEVLVIADGKDISQINTQPINITLFENSIVEWEAHARQTGAANEAIMGEPPSAGTPFKLQELVTSEAHSLHEYRKGKIATFFDEVYMDWIVPHISKEITKGQEFLSELDLDELQQVADALVICETNDILKKRILNGEQVFPDQVQQYKDQVRESFMRGGNKKFLSILEEEMKDAPISVRTNIAGKQKDLNKFTDKLVNVFRQIIAAPGVLDDPRMAKIFNQILESSGLSPIDFYQAPRPQAPQIAQNGQNIAPRGGPVAPAQLVSAQ